MRRSCFAAALLLLMLLCTGSVLFAQTSTGQVNGTVTDQTGAAVPGANVTITNQGTKISDTSITNPSGYFLFINLQPGPYTLNVKKEGFNATDVAAFVLGVNQTVTQNLKLSVGSSATTVEVTAENTLIDTASSDLGTVIEQREVNDLPLNGRNFTQLLTLTPGTTPISTSQNNSIGGGEGNYGIPNSGFSDAGFQGQNNRSKIYFFDGIINTNVRGPTYTVLPNIDLVQEFKAVSHDPKAEFGGVAGGVINIVSKSGTNSFHGSAFEYLRNNFFDARNSVTDTTRTGPAAFRQNQFGATFSGPIIKNKTFFSGGYDGWRYSKPTQARNYVPTAAQLNGDFSAPVQGAALNNIYNPFSGPAASRTRFQCDVSGNPLPANLATKVQPAGIPCNKIPSNLIDPGMQSFLTTYLATPNLTGDPANNFVQTRATTSNSDNYQIRVDHHFSDKDFIWGRYNENRLKVNNPEGEVDFQLDSSKGRNYGGGWVHTFGSSLILDVRGGYSARPDLAGVPQVPSSLGLGPIKQAGFGGVDQFGGLLARLTTPWNNPGGQADIGARGPAPRGNPDWSFTPNVSWLKGNHNFKTGFWFIHAERSQLNTFQQFFYANTQTQGPTNTGLSLASALLGLPNTFQAQLPVLHGGPVRFNYAEWAVYAQDEWKIRRNVTLNLGVRLDALTQPQTTDGRLWNALDLFHQKWIIGASSLPGLCSQTGAAPCIPDAFQTDPHFGNVVLAGKKFFAPPALHDNWGPRVGIAWAVTPKTVVRTGYGIYYDAVIARSQYAQNDLEMAVWPDATAFAGTVNTTTTAPAGLQTMSQITNTSFPNPLPTTNPWSPVNVFGDDPNIKDAYSQQWNLELERQLGSTMMVSVAYVGSKDNRLPYTGLANAARTASPNPANPAAIAAIDALKPMPWVTSNLRFTEGIGYSTYNALEAKLQRRFANGLTSLLSYTYGKSIDISSGYFGVENGGSGSAVVQNFFDARTAKGISSYDITHFLSWAMVYELPFGHGKRWASSGPLSWIIGNWQADSILQARSGAPYNIVVAGDPAHIGGSTPGFSTTYARPNLIANPFTPGPVPTNPDPGCATTISNGGKAADATHTLAHWFNPCAFAVPVGAFGNLGPHPYRGNYVFNMDYSMFKKIPLPKEGWDLQLRCEAFNVFNVQNYDIPNALTVGTATTTGGTITSSAGQITGLAQGTQPRELQFGLRFDF